MHHFDAEARDVPFSKKNQMKNTHISKLIIIVWQMVSS